MSQVNSTTALSTGWWRWPLVPFAAVLGALVGSALFFLFQWGAMKMQGGFREDGWWFLYIMPVMQAAAFGYFYTWISCAVAPRGKFITGVVMVTTLFVFLVLLLLFAWLKPPVQTGPAIQATLGAIATGIACILGLVQARDEHG